jgi:hypothetical protein
VNSLWSWRCCKCECELVLWWWLDEVSTLHGVVALEVEVRELVAPVLLAWHARRGFLAAVGAGEGGKRPAPSSFRRSRRPAAVTQVLLTWVSQSKPRLLQQVRQRLCAQPFFAWLPQS